VLASIAIFVWVSVEPGIVRTLAYNTIMIAGISTVLFNGNPLLRFDGYHMLADLTEIPNLGQRANKYIGYLCERYPFGCEEAQVPHATRASASGLSGILSAPFSIGCSSYSSSSCI